MPPSVAKRWPNARFTPVDFAPVAFGPDIGADKIYVLAKTARAVEVVQNNMPPEMHLFISRDQIAFISHPEAIKSKAIDALATHWGIKPEEIVGFGDDWVDIDTNLN